jgi:hypothetical protein
MIDRAIALIGLAIALILGLYTFAPEGWPKVPPVLTVAGMCIGTLLLGLGAGMMIDEYRKSTRASFEIEFDPKDNRFVRIETDRTRYFIALRNITHETIAWPSIRAARNTFIEQAITPVDPFNWGHPVGALYVFVGGAIDPDASEFIELFGLAHQVPQTGLLSEPHTFSLEARGRHAKTFSADFAYDPKSSIRIKRC